MGTEISFPFPLATAPTPRFVAAGGPAVAQCPGTAAAPEAQAGNLCVYEGSRSNFTPTCDGTPVFNPVANTCGSVSRHGAAFGGFSVGGGQFRSSGSWAVTAP